MPTQTAREVIEQYARSSPLRQDALLDLLHRLQEALGYLSDEALVVLADALNLSRAEVYGVASFYHDFHFQPRGPCLQVCNGEACQARGSAVLMACVDENGLAERVSEVFCLGNCAVGPNVRIGDRIIGRVDVERLRALVGATGEAGA